MHPLLRSLWRIPTRTLPLGEGLAICNPDARLGAVVVVQANAEELWPAPHLAHNCVVLQMNSWICEDCGKDFPRDPSLGDFPEEAIIEGECEYTLDDDEWSALQHWGLGDIGGEA